VRFAWPAERRNETTDTDVKKDAVKVKLSEEEEEGHETIDLEAQTAEEQPRTIRRTSSRLSTLSSSIDPWKLWSNIHSELSRLAAIRTKRMEDESSHVTLAKQKNLASSNIVRGLYNQDDFDFALVLREKEAYAFWAQYLDFRDEALCCYEEDGSTIASMMEEQTNDKDETLFTPANNSGLRRRKNAASVNSDTLQSSTYTPQPTPFSNNLVSPPNKPSNMMIKSSQKRTLHHQKSLFERAVDKFSPRFSLGSPKSNVQYNHSSSKTPSKDDSNNNNTPDNRRDVYSTTGKLRRRWGNQEYHDTNLLSSIPNLTSPPIVSLKGRRMGNNSTALRKTWKVGSGNKRTSSLRKNRSLLFESAEKSGKRGRETLGDGVGATSLDEGEEDNFFASPGIPRGVGECFIHLCTRLIYCSG
jgi:hypothetical protein